MTINHHHVKQPAQALTDLGKCINASTTKERHRKSLTGSPFAINSALQRNLLQKSFLLASVSSPGRDYLDSKGIRQHTLPGTNFGTGFSEPRGNTQPYFMMDDFREILPRPFHKRIDRYLFALESIRRRENQLLILTLLSILILVLIGKSSEGVVW